MRKLSRKVSADAVDERSHSGRFWLAYDIGLSASYDRLFAWLDNHQAQECGDNVATFVHNGDFDELVVELQRLIGGSIRAYLIGKAKKGDRISTKGRFIRGRRKAPPWTGYGTLDSSEADEG